MGHAARQLPTLVVALALLIPGCRSVWVHPDATEAMYLNDSARCKYGISNEALERAIATPSGPLPQVRSDWKQCMGLLGWHTQVRRRSSPPWGYP
jgi:hypothetical protein